MTPTRGKFLFHARPARTTKRRESAPESVLCARARARALSSYISSSLRDHVVFFFLRANLQARVTRRRVGRPAWPIVSAFHARADGEQRPASPGIRLRVHEYIEYFLYTADARCHRARCLARVDRERRPCASHRIPRARKKHVPIKRWTDRRMDR